MKTRLKAVMAGVLCLLTASAAAEGARDAAPAPAAAGATAFSLLYRADVIATLAGGVKRGTTALGHLDAKFDVDLDPLLGWQGVTLGLHGIASHGGKPNEHLVGSSQGVDNIEVETNTAKLFQAWIQKQWGDDQAAALFGLYDLNSEFYVSHSTGIFLHPSPGIGSEFAQSGRNGPSIFPTTSLALRLKYRPTPETYVQAAVLDAVPGDPDDEAELPPTDKYALGYWSYTAPFEDLVDVDDNGDPVMRAGDSGFYILAEKILFRGARPGSHVDGFIRYGRANADVHPISTYLQTGLVFTKMIPGREDDQFAISYSRARTADKYRLAIANAGEQATEYEAVWEATYRVPVTPWLTLQPDVQYVVHPGADAQIKNATVLGLRFEFSLDR
jgi:porin